MSHFDPAAIRRDAAKRRSEVLQRLGANLRGLRVDAGLSLAAVADAAGLSIGHLSEIERGMVDPSTRALASVAIVLGADLGFRVFPGTGPLIRDHVQAAIAEELLRTLHPRWIALPEVPVWKPVRGVIDLVLHDRDAGVVVASEIHSELRRLEQQIRWAGEKSESLPSADFWRFAVAEAPPKISRLLALRSTRATRALAERYRHVLAAAYPARTADVIDALIAESQPWPGAGIVWATVERGRARIMDRPPRGVELGR